MGQNFIFDNNLLDAIVSDSGAGADDTVVEIGTGAGTLTSRLALRAKKVFSFEVDKTCKTYFRSPCRAARMWKSSSAMC